MKISGRIAIFWAVLTFCGAAAQAQNNSSGMSSVDFSVHADVEAQARQPLPSQNAAKRPTVLSSWSSQPAKQVPSTVVWPSHATSREPRNQPDPFGTLALQRAHGSPALPLTQKDPASPASAPPEIQGFPSLFARKQPGLTGTVFQNNFPHAKGFKAKRHKPHPPGSIGVGAADSLRSPASGKR